MDPLGTYPGDRIDRSIQMIKSSCGPGGYPTNQSVTVRGWWKVTVLLCLFVFDFFLLRGRASFFASRENPIRRIGHPSKPQDDSSSFRMGRGVLNPRPASWPLDSTTSNPNRIRAAVGVPKKPRGFGLRTPPPHKKPRDEMARDVNWSSSDFSARRSTWHFLLPKTVQNCFLPRTVCGSDCFLPPFPSRTLSGSRMARKTYLSNSVLFLFRDL